jgi:hypothetical protein
VRQELFEDGTRLGSVAWAWSVEIWAGLNALREWKL